MPTLLSQLQSMTVVVADTGALDAIAHHRPQDATTNPSLITKAAQMAEYSDVVDAALRWAQDNASSDATVVERAVDRLSVEFGLRILKLIPGRVSTEVDARLSYNTQGTIEKARYLIGLYEEAGVSRDRVLIKIASTWEGIQAAKTLQTEGIHCNLTLLFGLHQAIACANAKVTLISPFVGRILDWHKKHTGKDHFEPHEDPGVQNVTTIYNYFKKHGHTTEVMGASFRNLGEITELAGCDLLTISPTFLTELAQTEGDLPRKLSAQTAPDRGGQAIAMNEDVFRTMHQQDAMANDKLAEGIEGFSKALQSLETLLTDRLATL